MPYITQENRNLIDKEIDLLIKKIGQTATEDSIAGVLNYCITRLLNGMIPLQYRAFNELIGVLECVKLEFYRRTVVPYENKKIQENGDI